MQFRVGVNGFVTSSDASPNFNQNQSANRSGHFSETALLLLLDRIYLAANGGRSTLLVSLDLSAAFDTLIMMYYTQQA